jgi:hypothetical protein
MPLCPRICALPLALALTLTLTLALYSTIDIDIDIGGDIYIGDGSRPYEHYWHLLPTGHCVCRSGIIKRLDRLETYGVEEWMSG